MSLGKKKTVKDCSSVCAPATHMGDLNEAPGFWPGPALAVVVTWRANQWMEDLFPFASL